MGSICGFSLKDRNGENQWVEYYFATNLQGDVLQVYQADNNTLVANYTYDAWGNILNEDEIEEGSLADINPFRYRGYYYDQETDFYYLQSRYYDPEIGRFINADGVTFTGQGFLGNNMFAYCLNNPVNFADYDGEDAEAILAWWCGGASWLCFVDGALPIGDLIYIGGLVVLSAICIEISKEIASKTATWDYNASEETTLPQETIVDSTTMDTIWRRTASKPVNLPSWKKLKIDWEHIKSGHMPGGSRNPKGNKSIFYGLTAYEIQKAIQEAYNNASKLATRGERILLNGYSESYGLFIEMWINIKEFIIETAYPK